VDQVAGEHPVAFVHQLGQLGQPVFGGKETFGLALDRRQILGADRGGFGLGAAAGGEAEREHHGQTEKGDSLQQGSHGV